MWVCDAVDRYGGCISGHDDGVQAPSIVAANNALQEAVEAVNEIERQIEIQGPTAQLLNAAAQVAAHVDSALVSYVRATSTPNSAVAEQAAANTEDSAEAAIAIARAVTSEPMMPVYSPPLLVPFEPSETESSPLLPILGLWAAKVLLFG